MEKTSNQADVMKRDIAAEQVTALLQRFPLLLDPSESRTVEQVRADMITARINRNDNRTTVRL